MGVKFGRGKLIYNTTNHAKEIQEYYDTDKPALPPIMGITRCIPEGRSSKEAVQYTKEINGRYEHVTEWVPMGQEGWTIKMQGTLWYRGDVDEIALWQTVDAPELVFIISNCVNRYGEEDTTSHKAYKDLPNGTNWYVDHLLIASTPGTTESASFEMTLCRAWVIR